MPLEFASLMMLSFIFFKLSNTAVHRAPRTARALRTRALAPAGTPRMSQRSRSAWRRGIAVERKRARGLDAPRHEHQLRHTVKLASRFCLSPAPAALGPQSARTPADPLGSGPKPPPTPAA